MNLNYCFSRGERRMNFNYCVCPLLRGEGHELKSSYLEHPLPKERAKKNIQTPALSQEGPRGRGCSS
jgi:hypothetical protein